MTIAYQFDAKGYFVGACESFGVLPHNATYAKPESVEGCRPRWVANAWTQCEDHIGEEGYINGVAYKITELGPLPKAWRKEPLPAEEAVYALGETNWSVKDKRPLSDKEISEWKQRTGETELHSVAPASYETPLQSLVRTLVTSGVAISDELFAAAENSAGRYAALPISRVYARARVTPRGALAQEHGFAYCVRMDVGHYRLGLSDATPPLRGLHSYGVPLYGGVVVYVSVTPISAKVLEVRTFGAANVEVDGSFLLLITS